MIHMNDKKYLDQLKGARLIDIGRCANMIWIIFLTTDNVEYSLHIQCPCRWIESGAVIVGSGDIYYPPAGRKEEPDFNWHDFDWDVQGNNSFDIISKELLKRDSLMVTDYSVNEYFDLSIQFQNGVLFYSFNDGSIRSDEIEQWRLFPTNSEEKHFVVTSHGYEWN